MKKLRIKYKMLSPVSHIGEVASVGSYFQTIKTDSGRLPIITANSVRGILRDNGAKFILDTLGCKVDKEIFHVLFSGGNLSGSVKMDVGRAKEVRHHFPFISMFGGGLGDMIMSGKMAVGNLYPVCKEADRITGIYSEISWKNLIDEIEFTRTDDGKEDNLANLYMTDPEAETKAAASTQMRYSVQYMAAGTEFVQEIILNDNVSLSEEAALYAAFAEWFKRPIIGGMANKGFGKFSAETDFGIKIKKSELIIDDNIMDLISEYTDFLTNEGTEYLYLLKAGGKNGKK